MFLVVLLLGLAVGVLVGLMGVGGGILLVPALVYLMHMDQHLAQGTSLFVLLPPLGLGALLIYWRQRQVDLFAGTVSAAGILLGAFLGSRLAIHTASRNLEGFFGLFMMFSAVLLWHKPPGRTPVLPGGPVAEARLSWFHLAIIFVVAVISGIAAGMFGVGGGVLLTLAFVLVFRFDQHRAQGTSLVALVPPSGLLGFLEYARAGYVSWPVGLLLMPGVFFGAIAGGRLAQTLNPQRMRRVFAVLLFVLGAWQAFSAWRL